MYVFVLQPFSVLALVPSIQPPTHIFAERSTRTWRWWQAMIFIALPNRNEMVVKFPFCSPPRLHQPGSFFFHHKINKVLLEDLFGKNCVRERPIKVRNGRLGMGNLLHWAYAEWQFELAIIPSDFVPQWNEMGRGRSGYDFLPRNGFQLQTAWVCFSITR